MSQGMRNASVGSFHPRGKAFMDDPNGKVCLKPFPNGDFPFQAFRLFQPRLMPFSCSC